MAFYIFHRSAQLQQSRGERLVHAAVVNHKAVVAVGIPPCGAWLSLSLGAVLIASAWDSYKSGIFPFGLAVVDNAGEGGGKPLTA
ncbi:MAG: hypothetical protein L6V87_02745 [Ruminococcus sp.]|nr:MAG: hypothetical protein L6V87_02745 [Ruminococcus sp.]